MMVKFSRAELSKLSVMVNNSIYEAKQTIENEDAAYLERALAQYHKDWMESIAEKLSDIIYSDAKRVEITN